MKNKKLIIITAIVMACIAASCFFIYKKVDFPDKININAGSQLLEAFESSITLENILDDVNSVQLEQLAKENKTTFSCSSKRKKDLTVTFAENDRSSIDITCSDYSVHYEGFDPEKPYHAAHITATTYALEEIIPCSITYCYDGGDWYVSYATFFSDDGYHIYKAEYNGNVLKEDDRIVITTADHQTEADLTNQLAAENNILSVSSYSNKLTYRESSYGTKQWFITAEFILSFKNEDDADTFCKKNNAAKKDENTVTLGTLTVPAALDNSFIMEHLDLFADPNTSFDVVFNVLGEIEGLEIIQTDANQS